MRVCPLKSKAFPWSGASAGGGALAATSGLSRPGIEAYPLDVRNSIYQWFQTPGFPQPPADEIATVCRGPRYQSHDCD